MKMDMKYWVDLFKSQDFVGTYNLHGLDKCKAEIAGWLALNREKILLAWFAEHGFDVGSATLVEERSNGEIRTYIRGCTAEEKERAKATANGLQAEMPSYTDCEAYAIKYADRHGGMLKAMRYFIAQQIGCAA